MRIWQLDFFRGTTLLAMLLFNWSFLLHFLGIYTIAPESDSTYWWLFPRTIVAAFVTISGIALMRSYDAEKGAAPFIRRSLHLAACALLVSGATYLFFPSEFVVFGILHFMAVAGLIAYPMIRYVRDMRALVLLGSLSILIGAQLGSMHAPNDIFLALGFRTASFSSLDYEPLFPWIGFLLFGLALGKAWKPAPGAPGLFGKAICWLGRNTLTIYLLHQPFLIAIILLIQVIK